MLDRVLTVAIGRNNSEGVPLSNRRWRSFQNKVSFTLGRYGNVVAKTNGGGVGSDGVNDGSEEESAIFLAINVSDIDAVRERIAQILPQFGQGSACFAIDREHEPVFATTNGYREVTA